MQALPQRMGGGQLPRDAAEVYLPQLVDQMIQDRAATYAFEKLGLAVTDEEAVALDGKVLRGAGTAEQPAPHLLAFCTHESQETLLQVRESRENE